ncbi:MAG: GGDEF domain-containing protein [Erythrobacter sp.]
MITEIAVPLEAAMAASLAALVLGIYVGQERVRPRRNAAANPLSGLFAPANLEAAIDSANRRFSSRVAVQAVVRARIDQSASLRIGWDPQTREQVLGHIAAVMQAGVRRDDSFARIEGDGFTIVMPGADERAAVGVADRLRHALAQIKLPQLGGANPFTASFGVAAGPAHDRRDHLVARARAALEAAQKAGSDQVVTASQIEEIMFLPAPAPSADAA